MEFNFYFMVNKLLKALGIIFIVLIILGLIVTIILISLGGVRQRAEVTQFEPLAVPSPLVKPSPFEREILPEEKGIGEVIPETPSRLVIKTGTINMVVKDIKGSVEKITQYAQEKGGWVVSSGVTEREKIPSGNVIVRIPSEIFEEAMAYFRSLAEKVDYEGTQGQDVTEEYVDLEAQLRNLEATETQLLKIMERSGTISEVLSVQRELTNVRHEIERTKGRMQYLERSAKMATITVNLALSEELLPIPPAEKWRPKYVFRQAWQSLLNTLRTISYVLIWLGVYLVIIVPIGIIIWQGRKLWQRRKALKKV